MKVSSIGWTDYSGGAANFVTRGIAPGDCETSEGCAHCYVPRMPFAARWMPEHTTWYPGRLQQLARWRAPEHSLKRKVPHKPMCFVCDSGDLFHETAPDWFIWDALTTMARREDVIWQVLTKRPARMRALVQAWAQGTRGTLPALLPHEPLPNHIWLGVTAENQKRADERIPLLLDTPAAVRFVSVEPMLGPVDLMGYMPEWDHRPEHAYWRAAFPDTDGKAILVRPGLSWVICGAESGPNRRPFDVAWAVDLYEQCKDEGVPFFGKQDSDLRPGKPLLLCENEVHQWPDGRGA
jgi:protein gp37